MKLWTELEGAEFNLAVRGYDRTEVDSFIEAVDKKQAMLADAEKRANEILARAESHAANLTAAEDVEALREQASLMLEQASTMLASAQREAAIIRSKAIADGEEAVARIRGEADRMLAAAEAEAAAIVAGAEQQHDRLAAALRLLHEVIKVILDEEPTTAPQSDQDAAIA